MATRIDHRERMSQKPGEEEVLPPVTLEVLEYLAMKFKPKAAIDVLRLGSDAEGVLAAIAIQAGRDEVLEAVANLYNQRNPGAAS